MNENMKTITREMLTDKIDTEFTDLQKNTNEDASLFAYRKESMGHILNALYNTPVPGEMLPTAYGREDVLREVYLFWAERASRGDAAVDKDELALNCARLWLEDVRNEYRHGLLCDRIKAEYAEFIAEELLKTPNEIIEDAWKITCYNDILMNLENEEMDTRDIDALLTLHYPLANVYDEYLSRDMSDYMQDIFDTALEIARLQQKNLAEGYKDKTFNESFANEYLERYGTALPDDEADTDAPGREA